MTTIAVVLLFFGACLASSGTFAFLACATTGPDRETLRLTYIAACYGRRTAVTGFVLWLTAWPTTEAPVTLLLLFAACSATASHITRAAPELMRRTPA